MITTLTGSNSFALKAELDLLVSAFVKEHTDMALERIDGEEADYDRMREALESLPFLANRKLVVLRSPGSNKEFVENAERLLSETAETTDVIIVEPKLDKRLAYSKWLQKNTDYKEFNELDEFGLSKWLAEEAKKAEGNISPADAKYLIERIGTNQQLLASELNKLLIYDQNVSRKTIELLTEPTPQSTIFQLLDAAFAGNKKQIMKLYAEQRASRVEPQQIIAMLTWQLHVLAVVKTAGERSEADIASQAKINPFVLRKSRAIANKLSLTQLKKLVADLTQLDYQTKTSAIDADDALQAYLLSI